MKFYKLLFPLILLASALMFSACGGDEEEPDPEPEPDECSLSLMNGLINGSPFNLLGSKTDFNGSILTVTLYGANESLASPICDTPTAATAGAVFVTGLSEAVVGRIDLGGDILINSNDPSVSFFERLTSGHAEITSVTDALVEGYINAQAENSDNFLCGTFRARRCE